MSNTKTARWMDLLAFLLHHRFGVSRAQIFERVRGYQNQDQESARRKFERDKADLEALGIRIENIPAPDETGVPGYRLRIDGIYLPQLELAGEVAPERPYPALRRLQLSEAELDLIDRATRRLAQQPAPEWAEAAKSLRRKLEFDLPLEPLAAHRALAAPLSAEAAQSLAALQDGVVHRRSVQGRQWTLGSTEPTPIRLEPWGLLFQAGRWYCAGRDRDRDLAVIISVEDLDQVVPDGTTFDRPADFDVRTMVRQAPWEWGDGDAAVARVTIVGPDAQRAANRKLGKLLAKSAGWREATFEMTIRDRRSFLRWALSLGRKVRIETPQDLAAALEELRQQVVRIYDTGDR